MALDGLFGRTSANIYRLPIVVKAFVACALCTRHIPWFRFGLDVPVSLVVLDHLPCDSRQLFCTHCGCCGLAFVVGIA